MDEGLGDESMIYQSALSISEDLSTFTPPFDGDKEDDEQDEIWQNMHVMPPQLPNTPILEIHLN